MRELFEDVLRIRPWEGRGFPKYQLDQNPVPEMNFYLKYHERGASPQSDYTIFIFSFFIYPLTNFSVI
jgi:hypothetical protein